MQADFPDARDASVGAPIFFGDFDDEDAAVGAMLTLLRKGYRIEITPPSWEITQWHLAISGWPEHCTVEEAYELLKDWLVLLGGGTSGFKLGDDVADDIFGMDE